MDGVVSGGDGRYSRGAEAHYDDDQDLHGGAATTGRGGWRRGRGLNGHLRPSALGAKARAGGEGKSAIRTEVGHGILYLGLRNRGHEQLKLFREGFEAVLEFVVEPALGARGEEAKRIALGFGGFGSVARTEIGPRERVKKERIGAVGGGDGVLGEVERFGGLEEVGLVDFSRASAYSFHSTAPAEGFCVARSRRASASCAVWWAEVLSPVCRSEESRVGNE